MGPLKPSSLFHGPGFELLLQTGDFAAWDDVVSGTLGHHRSRLLPQSPPFEARILAGAVEEFQLLLLHGRGQVELLREQCGHAVLWLPLQGWSHERLNGEEQLAEQGMGLLFRPGDVMQGLTSEEISGVSILLPQELVAGTERCPPLLWKGRADRQLIAAALQLVETAADPRPGAPFAAEALVDALFQWSDRSSPAADRHQLSSARRSDLVDEACDWMTAHLTERFSVVALSQALHVSVRSLQYSFQAELGCTPMAQAKRLRLRRLRGLLQDRDLRTRSIAQLMDASGLLGCGVTAADYRHWCGESPRRTRQLSMG